MAETPSVVPTLSPESAQGFNEVHILHPEHLSEGIRPYSQIALANQARQAINEAEPFSIIESQPDQSEVIDYEERPIESIQIVGRALVQVRHNKLAA